MVESDVCLPIDSTGSRQRLDVTLPDESIARRGEDDMGATPFSSPLRVTSGRQARRGRRRQRVHLVTLRGREIDFKIHVTQRTV